MGFGASLPADGQRQKARAAPGRLARRPSFVATPGGLRDGRPSLRKFSRFARFRAANRTVFRLQSCPSQQNPSSECYYVLFAKTDRTKREDLCTLKERGGEFDGVQLARRLAVPYDKKKGRMADEQPSDPMFCGASDRNRTRNPLITNQLLYH